MNRRTRQRYGLVVLGSFSYACLLFVWFSPAAYLGRIVTDFGLSSTEAGLLTGAIPLTYVPIALFSGFVTDRIGPARAIGIGLVLFGSVAHTTHTADSDVDVLAVIDADALIERVGTFVDDMAALVESVGDGADG